MCYNCELYCWRHHKTIWCFSIGVQIHRQGYSKTIVPFLNAWTNTKTAKKLWDKWHRFMPRYLSVYADGISKRLLLYLLWSRHRYEQLFPCLWSSWYRSEYTIRIEPQLCSWLRISDLASILLVRLESLYTDDDVFFFSNNCEVRFNIFPRWMLIRAWSDGCIIFYGWRNCQFKKVTVKGKHAAVKQLKRDLPMRTGKYSEQRGE